VRAGGVKVIGHLGAKVTLRECHHSPALGLQDSLGLCRVVDGEDNPGGAVRPELLKRPLRQQLPSVHDRGVRTHLLNFNQQMAREKNGDPFDGELPNEISHFPRALRVKPIGGLVKYE
jgi:hypothetical protein